MALVPLLLIALSALARVVFRGVLGEDESFYLIVGHQWTLGTPPYVGAFDIKPPGSFALVALAEQAFGETIFAIKALEATAVAATALAIYQIGRKLLTPATGLIAALFWIVVSLDLSGAQFQVEPITCAFVSIAIAVALSGSVSSMAIAGLLIGAAASVKQPAIVECAPVVFIALTSARGRRLPALMALGLGMGVVPLAFLAFYAAIGHADALIRDAVLGALGRTKGDGITWLGGFARIAPVIAPALPLPILALLVWIERRRLRSESYFGVLPLLVIWLAAGFVGVIAVKSMYDHYYITLMPPLCLLAGLAVAQVLPRLVPSRFARPAQWTACAAFVAYFLAWPAALQAAEQGEIAADREAAAELKALGLRPEQPILVMERHMSVYLFAHAEPSTPVFHPMHVLCPFPLPDARDPVTRAFASKPAFVVLGSPGIKMACDIGARRREIGAALAADYCPVWRGRGFIDRGLPDWFAIYERKDQAGVQCRSDIPPPQLDW